MFDYRMISWVYRKCFLFTCEFEISVLLGQNNMTLVNIPFKPVNIYRKNHNIGVRYLCLDHLPDL
jgi:hypothetical protein